MTVSDECSCYSPFYVFYASWNIKFLSLLICGTLVNYLFGLALGWGEARNRPTLQKWTLVLGVFFNLLVLGIFKYYNFFASTLINVSHAVGKPFFLPLHEFALPLGISFYVFQGISYIVDVYKGETIAAERSPLDVLLFVSFFPHLVSGPIVRAADFIPPI